MSAENFSEWFRERGIRLIQIEGFRLYEAAPLILQAYPYDRLIEPSGSEINGILSNNRCVALRFSTPISSPEGAVSYHVICEDDSYSLDKLSKNARYDVRKGLEYAPVEQISFLKLKQNGWDAQRETLERQGRLSSDSKHEWEALCDASIDRQGFEAWAAIHDDQIVASTICSLCDGVYFILHQQSLRAHMSYGINNALAFEVTANALSRAQVHTVFYGLHSLDAPQSVDKFKLRMGFKAKPVRQRVVFHPVIKPLIGPLTYRGIRLIASLLEGSSPFSKAEGMMRFYLEGKKPLNEQNFPENIADQRSEILTLH